MYATPESRFKRTDIWREGEWVDLWSVVHFLSGTLVGLGFYFLGFGALASFALAFVSLTTYEMWEVLVGIEETRANRFMDVVIGMAGFVPSFFLAGPTLSWQELILSFAVVFALDIGMSVFGWRASQKAAALKKRMQYRYAVERMRLLRRRAHLLERFRRAKEQPRGK